MAQIEIIDNSAEVIEAMLQKKQKALETCGLMAEGYAKDLCPVDTGNLRNSISHKVATDEGACYVGTMVEYGIYVEFGTGVHASTGGGRPTPWSYQGSDGQWYKTNGQKPQPFIKPSVADHAAEYQNVIKTELET